ncbi:MAG: chorismate-binding protein, partial [Terracidiphilus sp.]
MVTADVARSKPAAAYDRAVKRLDRLEKRLTQPLPNLDRKRPRQSSKLEVKHRTAKKDFLAAVERTKEYIRAGDAFQVVVSQRFDVDPGVDSFQVYRALRTVNPSPYMFFLRFAPDGPLGARAAAPARISSKRSRASETPRLELAGSSPELLVRVHQGKVEYRPIAGSRPRGATEAKDNALAEEMLHDDKERA